MTDKQIINERRQYEYKSVSPEKSIIIDGVDVSGCKYYNTQCSFSCNHFGSNCQCSPNCYYKQLKRAEKTMQENWDRLGKTSDELLRKEQECEELAYENYELNELFDRLKAENDELKESQKNSRCAWKNFEGTFCPEAQQQLNQLKAENKHLNELLNQALKELEKTRENLTEIKEIAEENDELLQGYHKEWANNKLILQKISECEVEDE